MAAFCSALHCRKEKVVLNFFILYQHIYKNLHNAYTHYSNKTFFIEVHTSLIKQYAFFKVSLLADTPQLHSQHKGIKNVMASVLISVHTNIAQKTYSTTMTLRLQVKSGSRFYTFSWLLGCKKLYKREMAMVKSQTRDFSIQ